MCERQHVVCSARLYMYQYSCQCSLKTILSCMQAVALGAAVQAGIYEGIVGDAGVVDVWQAALGRALAQQHLQDDDEDYSDEDSDSD